MSALHRERTWRDGAAVLLLLLIMALGASTRCAALMRWTPDQTASDTPTFISLAENLGHGLGLRDTTTEAEYVANPMAYRSRPTSDPSRLQRYYAGDYGLSLLYWLAIHLFGNCASPPLLLLMLQVTVDCLNILVMGILGVRLGGRAGGLAAAALYAVFVPMVDLSARHPYTYFWAATFALWNLTWMGRLLAPDFASLPAWRRHAEALAYGLLLGLASMVRPTFYLVGLVCALLFVVRWRALWRSIAPLAAWFLVGQVVVMSPVSALAWQQFGQLRMPRPMWHSMYVGFGGHPNPYGIRFLDQCGVDLARSRGLKEGEPGWEARYEAILRDEVMRIRHEHPWLWPRNTAVNFWDALSVRYSGARLAIDAGRMHAVVPLFDSTLARMLLVATALGFLLSRGGRRDSSWLLALVLLQSAYFAAAISAILPPYGPYNSSYWPGFVALASMGFLGLASAATRAWQAGAVAMREFCHAPRLAVGMALGAAVVLCWCEPSSLALDPLLEAALALPLVAPLAWLASRSHGLRGARLATALWLGLSLAALLCSASPLARWFPASGNACLLLGMGVLCLQAETGLHPLLAAFVLVLGTRGHPEAGLAPFLMALLLAGRCVPVDAEATREARPLVPTLRWTAALSLPLAMGLAAVPGLGVSRDILILPAAVLVLSFLPFVQGDGRAWGRAGRVLGIVLALGLLLLTFKGLASWRPLSLVLLVTALVPSPAGETQPQQASPHS